MGEAGLDVGKVDDKPVCVRARDPGCQVFGDALVNKVNGNIHVAMGRSRVSDGKHIHEFNYDEIAESGFNTSHVIHKLRFGEDVNNMESVLEGSGKTVLEGSGMFHYYLKLIPTLEGRPEDE